MTGGYYEPGENRAGRVQDLFGTIARRYDLVNDLQSFGLHRWWKRRLARLAGVREGTTALDVCCGTGDVALVLARRGARVTGLDFSEAMLAVARQRAAGHGNIELVQGDALQLPFADGAFEVVTISYGLRNLSDVEGGLREMWRVLRPGGRLLILDFGKPENRLWRAISFAYLEKVVPWLGRWFSGDAAAYAYILESLRAYPAQTGVRGLLERLPAATVQIVNLLGGIMSIHRARRGDPDETEQG